MKVYRFRSISINTYRELITRKVWFSRYSLLNDPFEGIYINETDQKDYDELIKHMEICCYSKENDNLLMWAHYADSHRGICLEYEVDENIYNRSFFEVCYSKKQPILKKIRKDKNGMLKISYASEAKILLTKSVDWEYEKEIRVLSFALFNEKGTLRKEPGRLSGVYFGLNSSDRLIDDVDTILKEAKDIPFHRARLKKNKYKVTFAKIIRPTNLTLEFG